MNDSTAQATASTQSVDFRHELDAALDRLSNRYREPLLLVHIEGVSLDEAGRRLDLSPTALRTRLSRAREMLRQLLRRRGVQIASVATLSALLKTEAEAAIFSPVLESSVIKASLNSGQDLAPHILKLSTEAVGYTSSKVMLFKTKSAFVAAILLAILAITITVVQISQRNAPQETTAVPTRFESKRRADQSLDRSDLRIVKMDLSGRSRQDLEILFHRALLINDPEERLRAIQGSLGMTISDEVYRKALFSYGFQSNANNLFQELLKAWVEEDPIEAVLWAKQFSDQKVMNIRTLSFALAAWLSRDEAAAMTWAHKNCDAKQLTSAQAKARDFTTMSAAEISANMRETLGRCNAINGTDNQSIQDRDKLRNQLQQLALQLADINPRAAMEFALKQAEATDDSYFGGLMPILVKKWAQHDPDAALEWANALNDKAQRDYLLKSILTSWQIKHSDQPISDAMDLNMISDESYNDLMASLAYVLAIKNPQAAAAYLLEIKDDAMVSKISESIIPVLWLKSPNEAQQWVANLPSGELRDHSLGTLAEVLSETDFSTAQQLLGEIQNAEIRQKSIAQILRFTDALAKDLPAALELANQIPKLSSEKIMEWARWVTEQDSPAFRAWLDTAYAKGRIEMLYSEPKNEAADFRAMMDSLHFDSWIK